MDLFSAMDLEVREAPPQLRAAVLRRQIDDLRAMFTAPAIPRHVRRLTATMDANRAAKRGGQ